MEMLNEISLLGATIILLSLRATFAENEVFTSDLANSGETLECHEICGCNRFYIFDYSKLECVFNYEYLKEKTQPKNSKNAEKIHENVEIVFHGIIWSAVFFIICASVCFLSVAIYCCHIHISDEKLSNEVKELATKLNVDFDNKKQPTRKKPCDQKAESCNVVVEDANIMCM